MHDLKVNSEEVSSKCEEIIRANERCNIIFEKVKRSICWIINSTNTFFDIEKNYRKKNYISFYNFLPTFVLVKRKGYLPFAFMKGMEGGELLWRNLLPVGMKQIKNCSTVTVKGF